MERHVEHVTLSDGWKAVIYREWVFPSEVVAEWDKLAESSGDTGIFISYGWFENWWNAFGKEGELLVVVLSNDGMIAGIFPCRTEGALNRIQEITFLTNDHTYYNDFIVVPACRQAVLMQFILLLNKIYPDAQLFIDCLKAAGNGFDALTAELHQTRTPFQTESCPWAPWTDVSGDMATYQKLLPRKRKSDLQRCRKRAEQQGALSLEIIRQSDILDSILDMIFEIEDKSWKGTDGTAIKCDAKVEGFYRGIAKWAMKNNNLHLFILKMGNTAISMNFCLNSGRTLFCLKVGYDEAFKNLSPGNLLYWEMFSYLFETPELTVYNFMGACEPWKMEWTQKTDEYGWIRAYSRSLKGKSQYMVRYGWKNLLKRFAAVRKIKIYLDGKRERHAV
jgi:CelD/BcsL family acetyltransferase involved in cellulose biosynthesis